LPFWAVINAILLPLVAGQKPQWTAEEMRALFPALIGWLLFCFFLGILSQTVHKTAQNAEPDVERRRALLTFVVAGGGFSGAELAGGLNDFARGMTADYPNLDARGSR
jgi:hypothetical protein